MVRISTSKRPVHSADGVRRRGTENASYADHRRRGGRLADPTGREPIPGVNFLDNGEGRPNAYVVLKILRWPTAIRPAAV